MSGAADGFVYDLIASASGCLRTSCSRPGLSSHRRRSSNPSELLVDGRPRCRAVPSSPLIAGRYAAICSDEEQNAPRGENASPQPRVQFENQPCAVGGGYSKRKASDYATKE